MSAPLTLADISAALRGGTFDNDLAKLESMIAARKRGIAYMLMPGDTVRFSTQIKPTYLAGLSATVVRVNDKTVTVSTPLSPEYGRFSGGRAIKVPLSVLVLDRVPA